MHGLLLEVCSVICLDVSPSGEWSWNK